MFALDLLHVPLARLMLGGIEMPSVRAPIIGVIARDAKRLEQPFELQKYVVLTPAKHIRQHLTRVVINRVPEPRPRSLGDVPLPPWVQALLVQRLPADLQ